MDSAPLTKPKKDSHGGEAAPKTAPEVSGAPSGEPTAPDPDAVFDVDDVSVTYSGDPAIRGVTMKIHPREVTAFIGPSGCGKSTFLRSFNRTNDLIPGAEVHGRLCYLGQDLYGDGVDPVEVRRRIGMVFQKPNPFPKSIRENLIFGPKVTGYQGDLDELIESCLKRAALWDEVRGKLDENAYGLSGGQQQRLCIARAIAVSPDVLLMDEPCSSLDPLATARIEDLMEELKQDYTIVIVTHNMQQAARASDRTAFITTEVDVEGDVEQRSGRLVEYDRTDVIFSNPSRQETEDYVTGRFG